MLRAAGAALFLITAQAAFAAGTDFGVRTVGGNEFYSNQPEPSPGFLSVPQASSGPVNMTSIRDLGGRWGRVTSTYRSPAHNKRVGGVANSYHMANRAIDIARRPGVSHWQIASAYRAAGYNLIESLDEGDHSHFAFGRPGEYKRRSTAPRPQMVLAKAGEVTEWRIVYVGSAGGN
jgi:hypothetical protein